MTFWKWSKTAAANATADGTINWAEGMAPSAVNDSARALMAAAAKYRDDNAGSLVTTGTSIAYAVTTNQAFDTLAGMNGASLRLRFHTANGVPATLNVDGLGPRNLVTVIGQNIPAGIITGASIHTLVYDHANSCWVVLGSTFPSFASGTRMLFQQSSAPSGWTKVTTGFDNHALRVTTGTVTQGGVNGFTSVFTTRTIDQANLPNYTLPNTLGLTGSIIIHPSTGAARSSNLTQANPVGDNNFLRWDGGTITATHNLSISGSVTSGGSGSPMDFRVAYIDVIVATKD